MKKILSVILVAVMVFALAATAFAGADYSDRMGNTKVDLSAADAESVVSAKVLDALYAAGILKGDGQAPDAKAKLTRWQVCMIILRAINVYNNGADADLDDNNWADYATVYGDYTFADIDETTYVKSLGALCYCVEEGLIRGSLDDGKLYLKPNDNVTFAEVVTILVRALKWTSDAMNISWPYFYMAQAAKINLTAGIKGVSNNDEVTYGIVAQLVYNFLNCNGLYSTPADDIDDVLAELGTTTFEFGILLDGAYVPFGGDKVTCDDPDSLFYGMTVPKSAPNKCDDPELPDNGKLTAVKGVTSINDVLKAVGIGGADVQLTDAFRIDDGARFKTMNEKYFYEDSPYFKSLENDGEWATDAKKLNSLFWATNSRFTVEDADGKEMLNFKGTNAFWSFYELDEDGQVIPETRVPALTAYTQATKAIGSAHWHEGSDDRIPASSPITSAAVWYKTVVGNKPLALVWELPAIESGYLMIDVDGEVYLSQFSLDAVKAAAEEELAKLVDYDDILAEAKEDAGVIALASLIYNHAYLYGYDWDYEKDELVDAINEFIADNDDVQANEFLKDFEFADDEDVLAVGKYKDEATSRAAQNKEGAETAHGKIFYSKQLGILDNIAKIVADAAYAEACGEYYDDIYADALDAAIAPQVKAIEAIYGDIEWCDDEWVKFFEYEEDDMGYNCLYLASKTVEDSSKTEWVDADGKAAEANTIGSHVRVTTVKDNKTSVSDYAAELSWFAPYGKALAADKFNADVTEIGAKTALTAAAWCIDTNGDGKYDVKIYVNFELAE